MARKKKIEEPKIAIVEDNPDLVRDLATNAIINAVVAVKSAGIIKTPNHPT